jgi:hypothetical protein
MDRRDGRPLKELIKRTLGAPSFHEQQTSPRERKRRREDRQRFRECVEALVCNLAYAVLKPPSSGRIACARDNRKGFTRYDNRLLTRKTLVRVTKFLEQYEILTLEIDDPTKGLSTIAPTEWFARRTRECDVSFADFRRSELEEVVILTRTILRSWKVPTSTRKRLSLLTCTWRTQQDSNL